MGLPTKLRAVTADGKKQFIFSVNADGDYFRNVHDALLEAGATIDEIRTMLISDLDIPSVGDTAFEQVPIWKAKSTIDVVPSRYPEENVLVYVENISPSVIIAGGNFSNIQVWPVDTLIKAGWTFTDAFPSNPQLRVYLYYNKVYSKVFEEETTRTEKGSYSYGTSTTASQTLSTEAGLNAGAFSAKVSGSISTSSTITETTTSELTIELKGLPGTSTIVTVWQKALYATITDGDGKPINYQGIISCPTMAAFASLTTTPVTILDTDTFQLVSHFDKKTGLEVKDASVNTVPVS
ncbi:MAG: hypothetical protein C0459_10410 [Chitinophaga sp.]|jgi:hypothetical protein|nr:hypothetical protein [Chitinophaga sp.]